MDYDKLIIVLIKAKPTQNIPSNLQLKSYN